MLTFEEIEDCFPERGGTTDDGAMICSAQWLHDFAHAVAAKEREACAKHFDDGDYMMYRSEVAAAIRARSNEKVEADGAASCAGRASNVVLCL